MTTIGTMKVLDIQEKKATAWLRLKFQMTASSS